MPVLREAVWTPPITWANNTPLTEDELNEQVRNNLLFLKSGHLKVETDYPSSDITTTSTSLVSSGLAVSLTLEATANLLLGWSIPYEQAGAAATIRFDFFTTNGNYYVSSGTATPATLGLATLRSADRSNIGNLWSSVIHLGQFAPGNYPYTLMWSVSANTGKIPLSQHPAQLWLLAL